VTTRSGRVLKKAHNSETQHSGSAKSVNIQSCGVSNDVKEILSVKDEAPVKSKSEGSQQAQFVFP